MRSEIEYTMIRINCNRCGEELKDGEGCRDFVDMEAAREAMQYEDWLEQDDDKHYCPCCYEEVEDDVYKIKE